MRVTDLAQFVAVLNGNNACSTLYIHATGDHSTCSRFPTSTVRTITRIGATYTYNVRTKAYLASYWRKFAGARARRRPYESNSGTPTGKRLLGDYIGTSSLLCVKFRVRNS